ncbi:MAG: bifunctional UDP-N-acetylmuramoyl-tripeptide:D-alanyl-D-alanine ligase/alanine racemase [Chitinophagaceae bacterium]|nr:bifunctional UDP-N-acetylmuramoyl-tripeptide:D-alanyl-D-alanine ligase/alanine racemase [Chitinophagaceae bacterium]
MPGYTADILAGWTGATLIPGTSTPVLDHLLTDSRKLVYPARTVFFALQSSRRDGHDFIAELYSRDVRCFVVSREPETELFPEASFLVVEDTLRSLQQVAAMHRKQFTYPVVGITGSNGKTIVKEWANYLLSPDFRIVRSPKSYNSQIGVPLSTWQMQASDELALIEAGISKEGEMTALENIIRPDIGIFTHIGDAHAEGFTDLDAKVDEKMLLFRRSKTLICCGDHEPIIRSARRLLQPGQQLYTWGKGQENALQVFSHEIIGHRTRIHCGYADAEFHFEIPFTDTASRENALHCCALMLLLGLDAQKVSERMPGLPSVAMRLELKEGINRTVIINDSYSADWDSLLLAMDFLVQQQQHPKRTLILSDIFQSGKPDAELYASVAGAMRLKNVQRLIGIGTAISSHKAVFDAAGLESSFFPATDVFLEQAHPSWFRDEAILLKGARSFEFERIARMLEKKVHQTMLEINLASITHNLRLYQQQLHPQTKLMAMVKAFSYGAGAYEIASLLQFHRVDYLAVAYADEGVELRKAGIRLPIMVMNAEESSFPLLTAFDLQPELYSMEMARSLESFLQSEGLADFPAHIKLDTGMHRLGFSLADLPALTDWLGHSGIFRVQSVFSHLVASEDPAEDAYTKKQGDAFLEACSQLEQGMGYPFLRHIANTATIRRHPHLQLDMVRLGIGLYGVDPGQQEGSGLQEVSSLRTTIAQVRAVPKGETVGYNRKGKVDRDSLIATIRIGYADGYPRSLGNGAGRVWIRGQLFPVIGSVCMDMTMVDITGHPELRAGEEVVLFGKELPVARLAQWAGTIPYEILTGISQRVQRVYFED